jgi:hypothetical protein
MEPTVCASSKLQYWCQLKYFVIELTPILQLWRSTDCRLLDDGIVKPKHVGAFIVKFNVNFNILNQFNCALVKRIIDVIKI